MKYPRVTDILKPFTSYDSVPKDILRRAADRGTRVHGICAGLSKNAWIPENMIDEDLRPYIESYKQWHEAQVESYEIIEERYHSDDLEYTGQIDSVIMAKDGKRYLVDYKTSVSKQKTYPLQMAAYRNLLEETGIQLHGSMLVYLSRNGDFPNIDTAYDHKEYFKIFTSALDCYNYFHKRKTRKND